MVLDVLILASVDFVQSQLSVAIAVMTALPAKIRTSRTI